VFEVTGPVVDNERQHASPYRLLPGVEDSLKVLRDSHWQSVIRTMSVTPDGAPISRYIRGISVEFVEWPGGQSKHVSLKVTPEIFRAVRKGGKTIPLGRKSGAETLGLPSCSGATLHSNGDSFHRIVGPAVRSKGQWCLPVLDGCPEPDAGIAEFDKRAEELRRYLGLEPFEA